MERAWGTPRRWNPLKDWKIDYNVAPTDAAPIVRNVDGKREAVLARWGLIPAFAKGQPLVRRGTRTRLTTHNARSENMRTAPTFRGAWRRGQRCISPVGGWYEWTAGEDKQRLPWLFHLADTEVFALAGLWDESVAEDGTSVQSYTTITVPSAGYAAQFHPRMPAVIAERDIDAWLDGGEDVAADLIKPFVGNALTAYRVSTAVNSVRASGPECIEPLE